MDLGAIELQVFVSLIVVLGAAFVALVCDYLKGNNEQLREYNVELRVRREEQERRALLDPLTWFEHLAVAAGLRTRVSEQPPTSREVPVANEDLSASWASEEELQHAEKRVETLAAQGAPPQTDFSHIEPVRGQQAGGRPERPHPPAGAPASPMDRISRVLDERAQQRSGPAPPPESDADAASDHDPKPLPAARPDRWDLRRELEEISRKYRAEAPAPPAMIERKVPLDLGSEIERVAKASAPAVVVEVEKAAEPAPPQAEALLDKVIEASASPQKRFTEVIAPAPELASAEIEVPASVNEEDRTSLQGMQAPETYERLQGNPALLSGVVVSVGINNFKRLAEGVEPQALRQGVDSINAFIGSMLRGDDLAARASDDEWVLLFRGEAGAAAQKRINQVSERLWDYQLRADGGFRPQFSWGAVEVKDETFAAASIAARERMEQTRRNRNAFLYEQNRSNLRVVNG